MNTRPSAVDRFVTVIDTGSYLRIRVTTAAGLVLTRDGLRAVNATLDRAPAEYAITRHERERGRLDPDTRTTTFGVALMIPADDNAAAIAALIADDVRDVLALPGHLVRADQRAEAA